MTYNRLRPDELALLFTGSPAPAASKKNNTVQVVEEADDQPDSDGAPTRSSSPSQAPLTLSDIEQSLSVQSEPQKAGSVHPVLAQPPSPDSRHPLFAIEQLGVDRRLIVNRKRQLKMYRVWTQGKFRKL